MLRRTVVATALLVIVASERAEALRRYHVDPAPLPDEIVRRIVPESARRRPLTTPEVLERHFDDALALLDRLDVDDRGPESPAAFTGRTLLATKVQEIRAAHAELRDEAGRIRARLLAQGQGHHVASWDAQAVRIDERLNRLITALDPSRHGSQAAARARARRAARELLTTMHVEVRERAQPPPSLPSDRREDIVPRWEAPDRRPGVPPLYLTADPERRRMQAAAGDVVAAAPPTPSEAAACAYGPADLGESDDVQLTPEIRDLAEALGHSPARLFEWVANEIAFAPYYGSLKGAAATLWSRLGNATDQASLLIALLRASNVPARYVKGTIRFDDDPRVLRWLGAKTYDAAHAILAFGWIPAARPGPTSLEFTHVWVEACVPYTNYRGTALDQSGHRWVPLDPSFKDITYQPGIAVDVTFDFDEYLRQASPLLPHEKYAEQVEAAVRAMNPNWTLADVPYRGEIRPVKLDILPVSLPYPVVAFTAWDATGASDRAEVPDVHRYKLELIPQKHSTTPLNAFAIGDLRELLSHYPAVILSMPAIVHTRVTWSYKGATAADQAVLDAWKTGGNPDAPAPCSPQVNVVPVIKVEGVEQAWTMPLPPAVSNGTILCPNGRFNRLTARITLAEAATSFTAGRPEQSYHLAPFGGMEASGYAAIVANAGQSSDRLLSDRIARLTATVTAPSVDVNRAQDESAGEFLYLTGLKYHRYRTDAHRLIGMIDGVTGRLGIELAMTQARAKVAYVLDEPFAVYQRGYVIDLYTRRGTIDITTGRLVYKTARMDAYMASAYEAYVWQENARVDAVNAIRGIWTAREQGIPVLVLNQANWNAESPRLAYPSWVIQWIHLYAYISNYRVVVPAAFFRHHDWYGTVLIAETEGPPISIPLLLQRVWGGGMSVAVPASFDDSWDIGDASDEDDVPDTIADGNVASGNAPGNTTAGDPVNMVTGNMYHSERDVAITGRGGLSLVFERHYNSLKPRDGPLGFGWTHSFNQVLVFKDDNADGLANGGDVDGLTSSVVWVDGTGAEKTVRVAGEGATCGPGPGAAFERPRGFFFTVVRNADLTYSIREKNGLTYTFEGVEGVVGARARLIGITDRNGNRLTMTYAGDRLASVTDDLNRALSIVHDGNGRITQVSDFTGRVHRYVHDAAGNLVAYHNPLAVSGLQNPITYSYYGGGPLDHVMRSYTLPRGNGMVFDYYANGRVARHSTTLGETTTFVFNDFRRESTSVNERGFPRRYFFDAFGNATKIVEETGGERRYVYDANPATPHNRVSQQTPLGYETRFCYDATGNVVREITSWAVSAGESCATAAPGAGTVVYEYFNQFGQPQKIKDARGNYTIVKYDARGNALERISLRAGVGAGITNPATYSPGPADVVAWSLTSYDAYGNVLTSKAVRDAATLAGPTTRYIYDARSLYPVRVERSGDRNGDGLVAADEVDSAAVVYDARGRLNGGISGDWHPASFTYDDVDRVVTFTDGLGKIRVRRYDRNGNRVSETLPGVDGWTAAYDLADRRSTVTNAAGFPTTYEHDPAGNAVAVTNPDGFRIRLEYDAGNRVVRAMDEEGLSVIRTLDVDGKPRTVTDPNGLTTAFDYWGPERLGRLRSKRAPPAVPGQTGLETRYDYDPAGNATRVAVVAADGSGVQDTLATFDELNRPARVVGPTFIDVSTGQAERVVTCFSYDLLGHRTEVRAGGTADVTGQTPSCGTLALQLAYGWDDFGRKISETDALGRTWRTVYDVHGNPVTMTDPKGQQIVLEWAIGRQLMARAAGSQTTRWTRNDLGQVVHVHHPDPTALYSYTYDAAHRMVSVTDHRGSKTLSYDWSPGGLLNFFEDSDGNRTDYSYDPSGRLAQIWAPNGDVVDFIYDAGGRLVEKWFPNGVRARYVWNGDGTLASLTNQHGPTVITSHVYGYDGVGNRKTHMETVGGATTPYRYAYDNLNRLIEVRNDQTGPVIESYAYDSLGNRMRKTDASGNVTAYVYDAANQLLEARQGSTAGSLTMAFVYDPNGNTTRKCEGAGVAASLAACTGATVMELTYDSLNRLAQVAKTGIATQRYAYDDRGRRIRKIAGETTVNYMYAGADIHATFDASWGTATATYVHGPKVDDPILRLVSTGARYVHSDGLGSVVAVTTAEGAFASTMRYGAWGNTLTSTGAPPVHGYAGREPDETGLMYYRARTYDPSTGRFLQRDPLGIEGGINAYVYVANNPINNVDPDGRFAFFWHFFIGIVAGLSKGYGLLDSIAIGYYSMRPDLPFLGDTLRKENQVGHALEPKIPGTRDRQGPEATLKETEAFIAESATSNDPIQRGQAHHATQDVPHHKGELFPPDGDTVVESLLKTLAHFLRDIFPDLKAVREAIRRTKDILPLPQGEGSGEEGRQTLPAFNPPSPRKQGP